MMETVSQAENPVPLAQTTGERLFPTPEELGQRMLLCGITPHVTEFLVDTRISGVDGELPRDHRQLLEACTLTPMSYEKIAEFTNAEIYGTPTNKVISNHLRSTIRILHTKFNKIESGKYEFKDLTQVRKKGDRVVLQGLTIPNSDPGLFITEIIIFKGHPRVSKEDQDEDGNLDPKKDTLLLKSLQSGIDSINQEIQGLTNSIRPLLPSIVVASPVSGRLRDKNSDYIEAIGDYEALKGYLNILEERRQRLLDQITFITKPQT